MAGIAWVPPWLGCYSRDLCSGKVRQKPTKLPPCCPLPPPYGSGGAGCSLWSHRTPENYFCRKTICLYLPRQYNIATALRKSCWGKNHEVESSLPKHPAVQASVSLWVSVCISLGVSCSHSASSPRIFLSVLGESLSLPWLSPVHFASSSIHFFFCPLCSPQTLLVQLRASAFGIPKPRSLTSDFIFLSAMDHLRGSEGKADWLFAWGEKTGKEKIDQK